MLKREGDALEAQYKHTLETLGKKQGMLGIIFRKAQNKIQDLQSFAVSSMILSIANSGCHSMQM